MNQKELKEALTYSPETGEFFWNKTTGARAKKGQLVGSKSPEMRVNKGSYKKTSLAFLYMTGELPKGYVYRHNKDRSDYRWENLYETKGKDNALNQEAVKKLVTYDPKTGRFWRIPTGKRADHLITRDKYFYVSVKGKIIKAHRLAVMYMTGTLPEPPYEVDHIDRNKGNNAWSNLRVITHQENCRNIGLRKNSSSGVTGVNPVAGGKWVAHISINGKKTTLLRTADFKAAVRARKAAELKYY